MLHCCNKAYIQIEGATLISFAIKKCVTSRISTARYIAILQHYPKLEISNFQRIPLPKKCCNYGLKKSKGKGHQIDEARDGDIVDHTLFPLSKQKKKKKETI